MDLDLSLKGYEVTTLSYDEIVIHELTKSTGNVMEIKRTGLNPSSEYEFDFGTVTTLERPGGKLLSTVVTLNDLHIGEKECGVIHGVDTGPIFTSAEGEMQYPEVMSRSAADEIVEINPDVVIVKGDITANGAESEFSLFDEIYGTKFGNRLHLTLGNHDKKSGSSFTVDPIEVVSLNGALLVLVDTSLKDLPTGRISKEQIGLISEIARSTTERVLVFGHHHPWDPSSRTRPENYFGICPDDSEVLVKVFENNENMVGYFAGHTHRNRKRVFLPTKSVPFVEVAALKDYPGTYAEYRIFEEGIVQIHRRVSGKEALKWSEKCRGMYGGRYADYAFGELEDRCFTIC